ncbi:MAG: Hpt domain-containing protein [Nitrospirae bacterium]|nr:Hpt domain-containing protein [Nitrospirota bacterium]
MDDDLKEIAADFIRESNDLLGALDQDFVELEKTPDDSELINRIFRGFHTVKGGASFLGFQRLVDLCQHAESLMSKARNKDLRMTPGIIDVVFQALDLAKACLKTIEEGNPDAVEVEALIQQLDAAAQSKPAAAPAAQPPTPPPPQPPPSPLRRPPRPPSLPRRRAPRRRPTPHRRPLRPPGSNRRRPLHPRPPPRRPSRIRRPWLPRPPPTSPPIARRRRRCSAKSSSILESLRTRNFMTSWRNSADIRNRPAWATSSSREASRRRTIFMKPSRSSKPRTNRRWPKRSKRPFGSTSSDSMRS